MLIWSLVYHGFKPLVRGSNQRCNGYHAHLELSISWIQALSGQIRDVMVTSLVYQALGSSSLVGGQIRSNERCNGYHAHLEFSISSSGFKHPHLVVWSGQIRGVMVTMLIWSLVYRGFKLRGVMVWSLVYRGQIRGVMVSILTWSLVYRGFKFWSGQIRGVMATMLIWSLVYRGFKLW